VLKLRSRRFQCCCYRCLPVSNHHCLYLHAVADIFPFTIDLLPKFTRLAYGVFGSLYWGCGLLLPIVLVRQAVASLSLCASNEGGACARNLSMDHALSAVAYAWVRWPLARVTQGVSSTIVRLSNRQCLSLLRKQEDEGVRKQGAWRVLQAWDLKVKV